MKFALGKKLGMTRIFDPEGKARAVTLIWVLPCFISAVRTPQKHGYSALQIGCIKKKERDLDKKIHPRKDDFCFYHEFRLSEEEVKDYKLGDQVAFSFVLGDRIKVRGISKGKGFQGVVKRWGFAGAPASHGHRHDHRAPGSIGSAFPEKVFKGLKMAGRMGGKGVTIKGLTIQGIDAKQSLIAVGGAVPGARGEILDIISEEG